jgi:hypothetical protein
MLAEAKAVLRRYADAVPSMLDELTVQVGASRIHPSAFTKSNIEWESPDDVTENIRSSLTARSRRW